MATVYELDDSPNAPRDVDGRPTRVRVIRPDGNPTVKHVRGPAGVHDVPDDHPAALACAAYDLGLGSSGPWRWASEQEIYDMYERQGVPIPGEFDTRRHAKKGVATGDEVTDVRTLQKEEPPADEDEKSEPSEDEEEVVPQRATPLPKKEASKKS